MDIEFDPAKYEELKKNILQNNKTKKQLKEIEKVIDELKRTQEVLKGLQVLLIRNTFKSNNTFLKTSKMIDEVIELYNESMNQNNSNEWDTIQKNTHISLWIGDD